MYTCIYVRTFIVFMRSTASSLDENELTLENKADIIFVKRNLVHSLCCILSDRKHKSSLMSFKILIIIEN